MSESDARCDTAAPSDGAVEAVASAVGPHLDIRHGFCGGTGVDPRSNLDCTGCGGTGYAVRGQEWREGVAREVAREVLAAIDLPRREAEVRAEERAATLREVEAWMRERAEQQPHDWPWASFADALAAHFNPEAE